MWPILGAITREMHIRCAPVMGLQAHDDEDQAHDSGDESNEECEVDPAALVASMQSAGMPDRMILAAVKNLPANQARRAKKVMQSCQMM